MLESHNKTTDRESEEQETHRNENKKGNVSSDESATHQHADIVVTQWCFGGARLMGSIKVTSPSMSE